MPYFSNEFIKFFKELDQNNNREWFTKNKKRFEMHVKKPFESFVADCIKEAQKINKDINIEPKDAVFRIYRDIRFSKDKTPYKDHLGAVICPGGRKQHENPGYYVHASAKNLMIGGGAYFLPKDGLYKVRQEITYQPKEFKKIIENKKFKDLYQEIQGEKNKIIPKEFKADAEAQPLIANKQFYFMAELKPKILTSDDLIKTVREHFKAGEALNKFLNRALFD